MYREESLANDIPAALIDLSNKKNQQQQQLRDKQT